MRQGSTATENGARSINSASFEGLVAALVREELAGAACGGVEVRIEDRHPQRGRDIVVTAQQDIALFGLDLQRRARDRPLIVCLECKWTQSPAPLSQEAFASNALQNRLGSCDVFVLVTNAILTVNAYFGLWETFAATRTEVFVVDGRRLADRLEGSGFAIPFDPPAPDLYAINNVCCEQQIERLSDDWPQTGELTIVLRNLGCEPRSGRLFLQNVDEWRQADGESAIHPIDLTPYGFTALRLLVVRDVPDRRSELRFCLEVGDGTVREAEPVTLPVRMAGRLDVRTSFRGRRHALALDRLTKAIYRTQDSGAKAGGPPETRILSVTGPAGTGKSRLIQEAHKRVDRNRHPIFRFMAGGRFASSVAKFAHEAQRNGLVLAPLGSNSDLADLIDAFMAAPPMGSQMPILVLEDFHHADARACETVARLTNEAPRRRCPARIVVVGRTDFAAACVQYHQLVDALRGRDPVNAADIQLEALGSGSFRAMVRDLLPDAPRVAVQAIERLSARVPQHVIHCVEWLVDMSAVRVVHRQAVGIADLSLFNSRHERLPVSVAEVLADRFDLLVREPAGQAAQLSLAAAALLGPEIPGGVLGLAGSEESVRELLLERHFLQPGVGNSQSLQWQHESLLLHVRAWILGEAQVAPRSPWRPYGRENFSRWLGRGRELGRSAASALVKRPDILEGLSELDRGLLHSLAGDPGAAAACWAPALNPLTGIKGYSTADIDGRIFPYLRPAYESVEALDPHDHRLPSIAKAMAYVGGYGRSLADGIDAAAFAVARLGKGPDSPIRRRDLFWLEALKAHFRLDAGQVRLSQRALLELQARYSADPALSADPRLGYEIYNCLGMLYGYQNHLLLAEGHFGLAGQEAERAGDPALLAKLAGDRAILYQYRSFAQWEKLTGEAQQLNRLNGTERHRRHAEMGELLVRLIKIVEWPDPKQRREALWDMLRELRQIETQCEATSYFSVIPRIQLFHAALLYLLATDATEARRHDEALLDEADQVADQGLGTGLQRGIGYSSWQLANLRALIALRRGNWHLARRRLEGAREMLRSDGLLFLGCADLACPNQIVLANLVKLLHERHTTPQIRDVLRYVSTYETEDWSRDGHYETAVNSCVDYHALLARRAPGPALILDRTLRPSLGLVVWF